MSDPNQPGVGVWTIRILGELELSSGGERVELPGGVVSQTLVLIALAGRTGLSQRELHKALQDVGSDCTPDTLQRRMSDMRNRWGLPLPRYNERRCYLVDAAQVASVDAWAFTDGVDGLAADADPQEVDRLMQLWRGNPLADLDARARKPWRHVVDARRRLVEAIEAMDPMRRSRLKALRTHAALFPEDRALRRLAGAPTGKPRLLVVEDQIMDDITSLLEDEFEIVPADSYPRWCEIRDDGTLESIQAALVDRHLDKDRPDDSLGTIKVAAHLRLNTEIPVTLMSVDVDCSANRQLELCLKYRLMDVIRKEHNGKVNEDGLIEAARAMTDQSLRGRRRRMERWVASIAYHVQEDELFGRGLGRQRVLSCEDERDAILRLLGRGELEQAKERIDRFTAEYGQSVGVATP